MTEPTYAWHEREGRKAPFWFNVTYTLAILAAVSLLMAWVFDWTTSGIVANLVGCFFGMHWGRQWGEDRRPHW
jgi:hypothetical protein